MRRQRPQPCRARVALAATIITVGVLGGASSTWASELSPQVSTNWAGYFATTGPSTHHFAKHFTSVSGTWVQPTATCTPGSPTYSAFWVGLGGYSETSSALEQIGSEVDCSASGQATNFAWYELVPSNSSTIKRVLVSPGDVISATVSVHGTKVKVSLRDITQGTHFSATKTMRSPNPDTSSAEWIAEAPSQCNQNNNCSALPLTNFGSLSFYGATASSIGSKGKRTGKIDNGAWSYGQISLQASIAHYRFNQALTSSAAPGVLASSGNAFVVTYNASAPGGSTGPSGTSGPSGPTGTTGTSGSSGASGAT
jgi:hypothetical protein